MNKVILVLGGGGVYGAFGGGVLNALQKKNIYKDIDAIYASSAGVMNAAYFLAKQTEEGSQIYLNDLTHSFFQLKNIIPGILQLCYHRFILPIPQSKILKAVNIDYVIDLLINRRVLNIEAIKNQSIPFYVRLLNTKSWSIEQFDIRNREILLCLKAAISIAPYYLSYEKIDESFFTDVGIKDPLGLEYVLKNYPDHKIVVILNLPYKRKWWYRFKNNLEGLVANLYGIPFSKTFSRRENSLQRDLKLATQNGKVLLIYPPANNPVYPWTTNLFKLRKAFEIGQNQADKITEFIARNNDAYH